jgi:hypothetical protein
MEQRRFFEAKGEESGEWLVLDGKRHPPRVICKCIGWNAPKNAALIAAALQAHNAWAATTGKRLTQVSGVTCPMMTSPR